MSAILVFAATASHLVCDLIASVFLPMFAGHLVVKSNYDVSVASEGDDDGLVWLTQIFNSKTCCLNLILHSFRLYAFQRV